MVIKSHLKSTSIKKGCAKSKTTQKFVAGAVSYSKTVKKAKKWPINWATFNYKDRLGQKINLANGPHAEFWSFFLDFLHPFFTEVDFRADS